MSWSSRTCRGRGCPGRGRTSTGSWRSETAAGSAAAAEEAREEEDDDDDDDDDQNGSHLHNLVLRRPRQPLLRGVRRVGGGGLLLAVPAVDGRGVGDVDAD